MKTYSNAQMLAGEYCGETIQTCIWKFYCCVVRRRCAMKAYPITMSGGCQYQYIW